MKRSLLLALLLSFGLILSACTGGNDDDTTPEVDQNIVEVAQGNDDLSTLVAALQAAGLDDDLQGDGPFTVFAPDNDAFAALLESAGVEDLPGLITELGADAVTDVLQYHVVPGTFEAADLEDGAELETLEGSNITVGVDAEGEVTLNDGAATVTEADIEASNGVVHVIDMVLSIPTEEEEEELDIVETAMATPELSTLVAAVTAAELVETLKGEGPFTVLAPTNDAFAEALVALDLSQEELLESDLLADILTYHVIPGEVLAADLTDGATVTTVQGEQLTVGVAGDEVSFNGDQATVTTADIEASNGIVHIIDGVLLYPSFGGEATEVELSGANEVPAVDSEFEGAATVTLAGTTLTATGTYSESMIITDPGAHIHGPADATTNADILFPLVYDNETGTFTGSFDLAAGVTSSGGTEYTEEQLLAFLAGGQLYINLHTEANQSGELRGQIVPEVEEDGGEEDDG